MDGVLEPDHELLDQRIFQHQGLDASRESDAHRVGGTLFVGLRCCERGCLFDGRLAGRLAASDPDEGQAGHSEGRGQGEGQGQG